MDITPIREVGPGLLPAALAQSGIQVVQFHLPTCTPCRLLRPFMEQQATQHPTVSFLGFDMADDMDTAVQHQVRSAPTVIVFRDGLSVGRLIGGANVQQQLPGLIAAALADPNDF